MPIIECGTRGGGHGDGLSSDQVNTARMTGLGSMFTTTGKTIFPNRLSGVCGAPRGRISHLSRYSR